MTLYQSDSFSWEHQCGTIILWHIVVAALPAALFAQDTSRQDGHLKSAQSVSADDSLRRLNEQPGDSVARCDARQLGIKLDICFGSA